MSRRDTYSWPRAPELSQLVPSAAERDAQLGWWREARFGMFVHWGVSSYLGGMWQGKAYGGYAEHIQRACKIPMSVYRKEVVEKFDPIGFNADEWIGLAKTAGMAYFVITAKHHDGFAMYDSQVSDYNIVKATPFGRDPMHDLRDACRRHGVRFGFYYSHAFDWGEPDAPGNDWDWANPGGDKLLHGADWWTRDHEFLPKARHYVDCKAIPQLMELIRNYDPDILWFDTPHKLPPEENRRILAAVRSAKPSIVVNGRLVIGAGDYENTVDRPAEFPPQDGDWEGIPTTNESYGYNQNDNSHKSSTHFIRLLAKSTARGGNMLMNIGPRGDGRVDPADVKILQGIGEWWSVNGESIRGTTRTPLPVQAWGESTRKGNTLYLHVFDWPASGELVVGGLISEVNHVRLLGAPAERLTVRRLNALDYVVTGLPACQPNAADTVIALECAEAPRGDTCRLLLPCVSPDVLRAFDAQLEGALQFGPGKARDAWVKNWTSKEDAVVWHVRLNERATFEANLIYDAPTDLQGNRMVEGDAGLELVRARKSAGGRCVVKLGTQSFVLAVTPGLNVSAKLGRVTLSPGRHEFRVAAEEISGEELFRLRSLELRCID